ncbi:MAG TPA: Wall-associated protein precursor [Myxococcaceae bacterium]|nr:Wall-associated protein precursor [Myxococcaceae bacterium]
MLPLLVLLVAAQVPAVPGETTLVSFCKQGRLSACDALAEVNPRLAAELRAELAKSALRLTAHKAAEEEARETEAAEESSTEAEARDESSDCKGQIHHVISWPIFKELKQHETLRGLYAPRDKRFEAKAKDKESHCGYQQWHRDVDKEVVAWLRDRPRATPEQFMKFLREIYNRPEMRKRFPNGF